MVQIFLSIVCFFGIFFWLTASRKASVEPPRQSVSSIVSQVSNPEKSVRQQYGVYGEKLSAMTSHDATLLTQQNMSAFQPKSLSGSAGTGSNSFSPFEGNSPRDLLNQP